MNNWYKIALKGLKPLKGFGQGKRPDGAKYFQGQKMNHGNTCYCWNCGSGIKQGATDCHNCHAQQTNPITGKTLTLKQPPKNSADKKKNKQNNPQKQFNVRVAEILDDLAKDTKKSTKVQEWSVKEQHIMDSKQTKNPKIKKGKK